MKSNKFSYIRNEIMIQAKHKNNVVSPIIIKLLFWRFLCTGSCFTLFFFASIESVSKCNRNTRQRHKPILLHLPSIVLKKGSFSERFLHLHATFFLTVATGWSGWFPALDSGPLPYAFTARWRDGWKLFNVRGCSGSKTWNWKKQQPCAVQTSRWSSSPANSPLRRVQLINNYRLPSPLSYHFEAKVMQKVNLSVKEKIH